MPARRSPTWACPVSVAGTVGATYPAAAGHIGGYSVLEADSLDALKGLLDGHPHLMMGDGTAIDIPSC